MPKYIDANLKLLDPRYREEAPVQGDMGCSAGIVRGVDAEHRSITALVSTPNVDRYEEIVEPKAFAEWLEVFMSNPVFVAGHTYGGRSGEPTVIGHWTDMRVTDEGLLGTAQFAATTLAEEYWQLYLGRHMRAFSVGWLTHAWEMKEFELVKGVKKKVRVFTEVELLEVSAVAIPANRESLVRAAGFIPGEILEAESRPIAEQVKDLLDAHLKSIDAALGAAIAKHVNADPDTPFGAAMLELMATLGVRGHGEGDELHDAGEPDGEPADTASIERQLRELNAKLRR